MVQYIEDQQLFLPSIENGVKTLGHLFDCRTGTSLGNNLFGEKLDAKYINSHLIDKLAYTLTHVRTKTDTINAVEVNGNLLLELMAGLIKVEGSAEYDSNDKSFSLEETLCCNYHWEGTRVDLLPLAKEIVDDYVRDMLFKKQIDATHVVSSVILGGEMKAKISISPKADKKMENIKGEFFEKLVYGPMNASIKAKLKWLDSNENNNYDKQISILSKPGISKQPRTIKDMFNIIDAFKSEINQKSFFEWNPKICGVPIKFILVPINQFLDYKVEKLYIQLNDDIFNNFKNFLTQLQEYTSNDYMKKQIIENEYQISFLLQDSQSQLLNNVEKYERELKKKADKSFQMAVNLLKNYRRQKANSDDIFLITVNTEARLNPFNILVDVKNFIQQGYDELVMLHSISSEIKSFKDKAALKKWFQRDSGCKVLLKTNGEHQQVFHKLKKLSATLCKFGFEVAVAVPSISSTCSLSIRLYDSFAEYTSKIAFILDILENALEYQSSTAFQFFNICANIFDKRLPIEKSEMADINNLIKCLVSYGDIYVAFSRLDVMQRLTSTSCKWQFFVPIEAIETSFEAVLHLKTNHSKYNDDVDWVVGSFELNCTTAPLLLIFQNNSLKAICFDNFDLVCLDKIWNNKISNFSILSPEHSADSFHADRLDYVKKLLNSLNDKKTLNQINEPDFWNGLKLKPNESIRTLLSLIEISTKNDEMAFKETFASILKSKIPDLDIENIGGKASELMVTKLEQWMAHRNPAMAKMTEIKNAIQKFKKEDGINDNHEFVKALILKLINNEDCPKNLIECYSKWKDSKPDFLYFKIEEAVTDYLMSDVDDDTFYIQNFITLLGNSEKNLQKAILAKICYKLCDKLKCENIKTIQECLEKSQFYNVAYNLTKLVYDETMAALYLALDKMSDVTDWKFLVRAMNDFIKSANLWANKKFLFFVDQNINSNSFQRELVLAFDHKVPSYIPKRIASVLETICLQYQDVDDYKKIETVDDFIAYLRLVHMMRKIPREFRNNLTSSIADNETLANALNHHGLIPHWNCNEKRFEQLWNLNTISDILQSINKKSTPSKNIVGFINLEINDCVSTLNIEEDSFIPVREFYHKVFGKTLEIIRNVDFVKATKIIPKPTIDQNSIEGYVSIILSFLIQKIKMLGCDHLLEENIYQLLELQKLQNINYTDNYDDFFNDNNANVHTELTIDHSPNLEIPLCRLDCLAGLFTIADITVGQHITRNLSQFSVSMPLVIPNINSKHSTNFRFLLPYYAGLKIKWEQREGSIVENYLFKSPFRLILAVRVGTTNDIGKSTILNQVLLSRNTKNVFSSKSSPGNERGPALTLPGSVEFIWLTEETTESSLWTDCLQPYYCSDSDRPLVLLANLHGDALKYEKTLNLLKPITSSYIVFFTPTKNSTMADKKLDFERFMTIVGKDAKVVRSIVSSEGSNSPHTIQTSSLTNDTTIEKIRNLLRNAIDSKELKVGSEELFTDIGESFVKPDSIVLSESTRLIEIVKKKGCNVVKKALELQRGIESSRDGVLKYKRNPLLQKIVQLFLQVLFLPQDERMRALIHLETEISILSNQQSESLRYKIAELKSELRKIILIKEQANQVNQFKKLIRQTKGKLDTVALGLEHFYRELAQIYTINLSLKAEIENENVIFKVPEKYAELFINGQAIEILDGDAGKLHDYWLTEIFRQVSLKYPKLKVFVVTILGLQSSGKSTLLNALFACKFAVSVGRCTRGLFARLLFLDEVFKKDLNTKADAILLIDTEGLGAPEKMNDTEYTRKDRQLATFAMGISGLTIINVLGEYINDLTEILQIAIIAMARLEKAGIAPDVMLVQHHPTERNTGKIETAIDSFCQALESAIKLTEEQNVEIGIRGAKCLEKIFSRIQRDEMLRSFSPYKDGATANSPPSKPYQDDVVNLYKSIFQICQESGQIFEFKDWFELFHDFWSSVAMEDFAVNFKGLKEVKEFIELSKLIANAKESTDWVFRHHGNHIEAYMKSKMFDHQPRNEILNTVKKCVDVIPDTCIGENLQKILTPCDKCKQLFEDINTLMNYVELKENKRETQNTMFEYTRNVRSTTLTNLTQRYDAILVQNECCDDFQKKVDNIVKDKLHIKTDYKKEEILSIEKEAWDSLVRLASGRQITSPVEDRINEEVLSVYATTNRDIVQHFNSTHELELTKIKGLYGRLFHSKLDVDHWLWLNEKMYELHATVLMQWNAKYYEHGMIRKLKEMLSQIFKEFNIKFRQKLTPEFMSIYSSHVLKLFKQKMIKKESKWKKTNDPMEILHQKREQYLAMIRTRLQFGFSYSADGKIVSELLLSAIKEQALIYASDLRVKNILGIDWVISSETIRLKYFRKLIREIQSGNKQSAVNHFKNPHRCFSKWFEAQVNSVDTIKAEESFAEAYERQKNLVVQSITNKSNDGNKLQAVIREFLAAGGTELKMQNDLANCSESDLVNFISPLLDGLKNADSSQALETSQFITPFEDPAIKKRVGCTKACHFCGALCFGVYGHENDTGNTKMHHTLHQPRGLVGIPYRQTNVLVATSCNTKTDSDICWRGDIRTTWGTLKERDWIYTQSSRTEFRDLMVWFFIQLQDTIAAERGSKTVSQSKMKDLGWDSISNVDHIVAGIEKTLTGQ